MGHIRLGTLPQSKKWREVVDLLNTDANVDEVAKAASKASTRDLERASDDPNFQFISRLLVELPVRARAPEFEQYLESLGIGKGALESVPNLLASLDETIQRSRFKNGGSDAGELARSAFIESLSRELDGRLPSLFDPNPQEIRKALADLASGQNFAVFARGFFARLSYRSLDYYLSRELANHTGQGKKFETDGERVEFQRALAQHNWEVSRIVKEFAGDWLGKTIWQRGELNQAEINKFTKRAINKMRSEFERR